jgi:DNA-binding CsgD family transcriptional regulator
VILAPKAGKRLVFRGDKLPAEAGSLKSRAPLSTGLGPAFILLDSNRSPVYANAEALRILGHRAEPALAGSLPSFIAEALRPVVGTGHLPPDGSPLPLTTGRRRYACRVFRLTPVASAPNTNAAAYIVMIDRGAATTPPDESMVVERYSLTNRETELLRYLMTGLTNKEIGERMHISPNTVKAFLKLMMTKMGVSTRSAVVGLAFEGRARAASDPALR